MLIALFVGDHNADIWPVRLGWWLTRVAQKGRFGDVTHCEAILAGDASAATIASSSVRDGGVRIKHRVQMNPEHWRIVDVPQWSAASAAQWFAQHMSQPYDWRGAWAIFLPGHHKSDSWFCNEAVGASVGLLEPHTFSPAVFAAACLSFGREVTAEFFRTKSIEGNPSK